MPPSTHCITRSRLLSITLRREESRDSACDSLQESGDQRLHVPKPPRDRYELEGPWTGDSRLLLVPGDNGNGRRKGESKGD